MESSEKHVYILPLLTSAPSLFILDADMLECSGQLFL